MLSILFLFLYGFFSKGVKDTLSFFYNESIFSLYDPSYWNPIESHKNKYKNKDRNQGPAFPGSTTFLVALTDAWHLAGMIGHIFIALAVIKYEPLVEIFDIDLQKIDSCSVRLFYDFVSVSILILFSDLGFVLGVKIFKKSTYKIK